MSGLPAVPELEPTRHLVTSVTAIMYDFGPISLGALRRSDPERRRPFQLLAPDILSRIGNDEQNRLLKRVDTLR